MENQDQSQVEVEENKSQTVARGKVEGVLGLSPNSGQEQAQSQLRHPGRGASGR